MPFSGGCSIIDIGAAEEVFVAVGESGCFGGNWYCYLTLNYSESESPGNYTVD